jgi:hypothetical protein
MANKRRVLAVATPASPPPRPKQGAAPPTPPPPRKGGDWREALALAIEVLTGTVVFLVVAAAAVLLSLSVERGLDYFGINGFVHIMLKGAEYFTLAVDLFLYVRFVVRRVF